ncbi:CHAT domain-containing protein [Pontibacterium granulatum]|uniref:CHAT domain-containing protein n=1 Tax=Pontibacterium granulatum TaxID=2036029 RepID=UPI00249C6696|nr:CHAT domain-containing protein [Pontibacterium granulatum]MDI3324304.1 CHAT domain-containing protein [Pontibacterium granulatum]
MLFLSQHTSQILNSTICRSRRWLRQGALSAALLIGSVPAVFADPLTDYINASDLAGVEAQLQKSPTALNQRDDHGTTPLIYAIHNRNKAMVELLVRQGADINLSSLEHGTPLQFSFMSNQPQLAAWLIGQGADVNAVAANGWTILQAITQEEVYNSAADNLQLLLDKGLALNTRDESENTLLHYAVGLDSRALVERLLAKDADPLTVNADGSSALDWALEREDHSLFPLLYNSVTKPLNDEQQFSLLTSALEYGRKDALIQLLDAGWPVNKTLPERPSLLQIALAAENSELAQLLLARGATLLASVEAPYYEHPLTYAGWLGSPSLLQAMAPQVLASENPLLVTQLFSHALYLGDLKTVQLLQPKLDRKVADEALDTDLLDAWEDGTFLTELIAWAHIEQLEAMYPGLLRLALAADADELLQPLLDWQRQQEGPDRIALMFDLIENRQDEALPYLRQLGVGNADLNQSDDNANTLLQTAIYNEAPNTALWLLKEGANPLLRGEVHEASDGFGLYGGLYDYPLAMVVDELDQLEEETDTQSTWWTLLDQLLSDPNQLALKDLEDEPILFKGLKSKQTKLTNRLINAATTSQLNQRDTEGNTPLHLLVGKGDMELLRQLLAKGIDLNPAATSDRHSPLYLAIKGEAFEVADLLLTAGATPDPQLYHHLYDLGHQEMLKRWIAEHKQIDVADTHGNSLLIRSLHDDDWPFGFWLLSNGANPNVRDNHDRPALWLATNNPYAFTSLLKQGAKLHEKDNQGRTLLHLVAEQGNLRLVDGLLEKGFKVTEQDHEGRTPIELAINQGHFKMVQTLADAMPEPDRTGPDSEDRRLRFWSALYWADRKDKMLTSIEKDLASSNPHPHAAYIWSSTHLRLDQLENAYADASAELKQLLGLSPQMLIALNTRPEQILTLYPPDGHYSPKEIFALVELANEVEKQQHFSAMFAYLNRVIEMAPGMWQPAWMYEEMALLERDTLRKQAYDFANLPSIRDSLNGRYIRALLQQHRWLYTDRLPYIEQFLQENPRDSRAWVAKSYALAGGNYFAEALEAALNGTAIFPFYANRDKPVELLVKLRKPEQARRYAAQVARWYGDTDLIARQSRYFIDGLIATGDKGQAREELKKALETSPQNARLMFQIANLELKDKRPNEAVFWMTKGATLKPDLSTTHLSRFMRAYRESGEVAQAYTVFEQYRKPRPAVDTYDEALGLLQTLKRDSTYQILLQEALEHYPAHLALNKRALRLQWQQGKKEAALSAAVALLEQYPSDSGLQDLIYEYKSEQQSPTQAQQFAEQAAQTRPWDKNLWQLAKRSLPANSSNADKIAFWKRAQKAAPYESFPCEKVVDIHVDAKAWTAAHLEVQQCLGRFAQNPENVRISSRLRTLLFDAWVYENQTKRQRLPHETIRMAEQAWQEYAQLYGNHSNYLRYREGFCRARQDLKCAANALADRSYFDRDSTDHFHELVAEYSQQLGAAKTRGYGAQMIARNPYDETKLRSFLHKNLLWSGSPIVALKAIQDAKARGLHVDKDWERKALGQLGDSLSEFEQYATGNTGPGVSLRYIRWYDRARREALTADGTKIFYQFDAEEPTVEILLPNGEMITRSDHPLFGKPTYFAKGAGFMRLTYTESGQLAHIVDSSGKQIRLEYNADDQIVLLQTSKGEELSFEYGLLGKPTRITLKDVGEIRVRYDGNGEIEKVSSDAGHRMALRVTQAFQSLLGMVKKVQQVHDLKTLPHLDHQDTEKERLQAALDDAAYESTEEQQAKLALATYLVDNVRNSSDYFSQAEHLLYALLDTYKTQQGVRNQLDAATTVRKLHQLYNTVKPHGLPRDEFSRWNDAQNWLRGAALRQQQPELKQILAEIDQQPLVLLRDAHWLQRSDFSNSAYWKRYGNTELFAKSQASSDKHQVLIRQNGDLVVASDNGLSVLRNGFWQWYSYDNALGRFSANLSPYNLDGRSQILALAETNDGTLWLGSSKGLMALTGDYQEALSFWGPAQGLTTPRINSLASLDNQVYAATANGVFTLNRETQTAVSIESVQVSNAEQIAVLSSDGNSLLLRSENQLWLYSNGSSQSLGQAQDFAWHADQGLLYWLQNGLVYRLALTELNNQWQVAGQSPQIIARQQDLLLSKQIHELAIWRLPEVGDTLVVNTDLAINVLKDNYFEAMPLPYETRRGGLQVGPQHSYSGPNGLAILSQDGVYTRFEGKAQQLSAGPVYDLLSDNELGLTFMATGRQILYVEQGKTVSDADQFSGANARVLTQDRAGNLITHDGNTIIRFQRGSDQAQELFRAEPSVDEDGWGGRVVDIYVDSKDVIWVTAGSSLFRYANDQVEEFNYILDAKKFPSRSPMLSEIYQDLNGDLYVVASNEGHLDYQGVTLSGGLLKWNGSRFENLGHPDHWFATGYTRIDANTAIVSTNQSFVREKAGPDAHKQRRSFRALNDPTYAAVTEKTEMLWLGRQGARFHDDNSWLFPSAGGVVLYHNGKWFYPDRLNQLLPEDQRLGQYGGRTVHAVSIDGDGRIYAATDLGVLVYESEGIASLLTDNQLGQIAFADSEHQQQQDLSEIFLARIDPATKQGRLLARYRKMQENIGELEQQLLRSTTTPDASQDNEGASANTAQAAQPEDGEALKKRLKAKNRVREKLLARIESEHYGLYQMLKLDPREVAAMHKQLSPEQALVQYLPTPDKLLIQVVTQEGAQIREVSVSRRDLYDTSTAVVGALRYQAAHLLPQKSARGLSNKPTTAIHDQRQHADEQLQRLNWLYEQLLRPVERELEGKSQVFITPVGALTYLPFPALVRQIKPQVQYAVQHFNLGVIPSMYHLNLVLQHDDSYSNALLMVADPDGSLPGARKEVAKIAADSSQEPIILEGEEATYDNLTAATAEARVMHLATHGSLNQSTPADSYLLLANSYRLNVIDIATLDLDQTDLVVLSACETGIGKPGLEYATLARAFAHAHVPTVVASYWKVDDSATSSLMQHFYRTLEEEPEKDYFSALAHAQRQMLDAGTPNQHPAAWAGFTVFGKP